MRKAPRVTLDDMKWLLLTVAITILVTVGALWGVGALEGPP